MDWFGRKRNRDRGQSDVQPNSTGYQEKTVFSTDAAQQGVAQDGTFGMQQQGGMYSAQPQDGMYSAQPSGGHAAQPQSGMYSAQPSGGYGAQQQSGMYSAQPSGGYGAQQQSGMYSSIPTAPKELPKVFASRNHKDIYIYEYSDRLEYYLRTEVEMCPFGTVKK